LAGDRHRAFKTAPQRTTWGAMLDVWRAADEFEVVESGWTFAVLEPPADALAGLGTQG
jgi:hypothetical protein